MSFDTRCASLTAASRNYYKFLTCCSASSPSCCVGITYTMNGVLINFWLVCSFVDRTSCLKWLTTEPTCAEYTVGLNSPPGHLLVAWGDSGLQDRVGYSPD